MTGCGERGESRAGDVPAPSTPPPASRAPAGRNRPRLHASAAVLAAVATALAAALIAVVPPGEAPDEPAHLAYVAYLRRHERLPPVPSANLPLAYEFYQPPLAYATAAALTAAFGAPLAAYGFESNPEFDFEPGERAFLEPRGGSEGGLSIACVRAANLVWMPVLVLSVVALCHRVSDSIHVALTASIPFVISPQVLFAHATFGNDAAVMALAAAATAATVAAAAGRSPRPWQAVLAGVLAGLALWAKASAALFLPAIVAVGTILHRRRRALDAGLLVTAYGIVALAYVLLEISRSGSILPDLPTGWSAHWGSALRLLGEPHWVASTWLSFWAKLGWFNVLLPLPLYLWFLAPTAAVARGAWQAVRRAREAWLLLLIGATNLGLLVLYLMKVDWQPQGRYLFPSLAALAGLAAIGVSPLCRAHPKATLTVSALASLAVAIGSIGWIYLVYYR